MSLRYLLDTSIISEAIRPEPNAKFLTTKTLLTSSLKIGSSIRLSHRPHLALLAQIGRHH
jgi:predicted nucleic acid-binding protein